MIIALETLIINGLKTLATTKQTSALPALW